MKVQLISMMIAAYSMLAAAWICSADLMPVFMPLAANQ
jgi:hypothetical protein